MSRSSELAKNTIILLIGRISTRAISFLLLPLYTAYLSRTEYGIVDLVQTLITLLCPIISLQMEQALFRYMVPNRNNVHTLKDLITSSFIFCILTLTVYSLVFIAISPFVHNEYKWYLLTNVAVAVILGFSLQVLRGFGKNIDYAITSFISSVGVIVLNIWFIVGWGWGAYGMLTATVLGNILGCGYSFFRSHIWQFFSLQCFSWKTIRKLLRYSSPLVPNELSWWTIRTSDRLIISLFVGLSANGIISIGHKFPEIFMTLYSVFGLAWTESIILHIKEKDGAIYFSTMTVRMFKFFSSVCLVIIACIPFVFPLMINEKFSAAYPLIPLYFIGSIINIVIGLISVIYVAHDETKKIASTAILAAFISVVSGLALVKLIGIYASPVSFILGYGAMMIYRCHDMKRLAKIDWDYKYLTLLIIAGLSVIGIYFITSIAAHILGIILSVGFFWIFNKSSIGGVKSILMRKITH